MNFDIFCSVSEFLCIKDVLALRINKHYNEHTIKMISVLRNQFTSFIGHNVPREIVDSIIFSQRHISQIIEQDMRLLFTREKLLWYAQHEIRTPNDFDSLMTYVSYVYNESCIKPIKCELSPCSDDTFTIMIHNGIQAIFRNQVMIAAYKDGILHPTSSMTKNDAMNLIQRFVYVDFKGSLTRLGDVGAVPLIALEAHRLFAEIILEIHR